MSLLIIVICVLIALAAFALIGIALITGASDDLHQELDDLDQIEYIRRWQEEKKSRTGQKQTKRRKR